MLENRQNNLNESLHEKLKKFAADQNNILQSLNALSEKVCNLEIINYKKQSEDKIKRRYRSKSFDNYFMKLEEKQQKYITADSKAFKNFGDSSVNKRLSGSFSDRLESSVQDYYSKIKREPLEVRNVEM